MVSKEEELFKLFQEYRDVNKEILIDRFRNRLKNIAKKKICTCFIFALSQFEQIFGDELWGHNLSDDMLNEKQKINRVLWGQVRKKILNKGNTQLRALLKEIDLHKVEFDGYHMNFGGSKNE